VTERPRALVFGEDAVSYDRARPSYPQPAIDHMLGLVDANRVVEIGAGTGKATVDVARPGIGLTCLEPSPEMAAVLRGKRLPGVEVVVSSFENWEGPTGEADLIFAAQSWHWVDRARGYERARTLLRPGGAIALMWNIPANRYSEHEEVYLAHAPHLLEEGDDRIDRRDNHDWLADLRAAGFAATERFSHDWSAELGASSFRALYATYSDHLMLPEPDRTALLDALEGSVRAAGGVATISYRTDVFSGTA